MKAKMNRYDLSLWDVRKLTLYGRASESVQAAQLSWPIRSCFCAVWWPIGSV